MKKNVYIIDKKTKKPNTLYLNPIIQDLETYYDWLEKWQKENPTQTIFYNPWLFPSFKRPEKHIDEHHYYMIMYKKSNIDYLGTHTMRKTGAYRVY